MKEKSHLLRLRFPNPHGAEKHTGNLWKRCVPWPHSFLSELSPLSLSKPFLCPHSPFHLPGCFTFNKDLLRIFPSTKQIPVYFQGGRRGKKICHLHPTSSSWGLILAWKDNTFKNSKTSKPKGWSGQPLSAGSLQVKNMCKLSKILTVASGLKIPGPLCDNQGPFKTQWGVPPVQLWDVGLSNLFFYQHKKKEFLWSIKENTDPRRPVVACSQRFPVSALHSLWSSVMFPSHVPRIWNSTRDGKAWRDRLISFLSNALPGMPGESCFLTQKK